MRLIDADAITPDFVVTSEATNAIRLYISFKQLKNAPTIDPVKHGHWEDENMDDQVVARCSVCNTWDTTRTPYCPHCGAYMVDEEECHDTD